MKYFLWLTFLFAETFAFSQSQLIRKKEVLLLMGSRFEFIAIGNDSLTVNNGIKKGIKEVERIEALISSWNKGSQTSEINQNAGIAPTIVDKELVQLIQRSKKISQLTNGAFDISFAAINRLWEFNGNSINLPDSSLVKASISKIDYHNISINSATNAVFLRDKGMKIGFGAIGKGYAANRAKVVMKQAGIESGVVNAGGDLLTWGNQEDGESWRVGVASPKNRMQIISWLDISNMAIVTSGNYEKFAYIDGKRFGHIIDPRTGYPSEGLKSVTVICTDAELADALATSVYVLGEQIGLQLINQLNGIDCMLITAGDSLLTSNNLELHFVNKEKAAVDFTLGDQ